MIILVAENIKFLPQVVSIRAERQSEKKFYFSGYQFQFESI